MVKPIMSFGDVVLAAGGTYTSKPRPVLIFQNDTFSTGQSTVVIPFTSHDDPAAYYRLAIGPTPANGLDRPCWLEVDKVSAIRSTWLDKRIGRLENKALQAAMGLTRRLMSPGGEA
ncbi:MAG: type II toxin-antitoxin system PemK/MazF family toxin [Micrococcales bacterium]|nr:type II toxin-antitoxin system PemK/MazF family toxin [Micrococcales bacterium]